MTDGERRLKVLMLAPSYLPRLGGVERHVRFVTRELLAAGLQVRLATPRWEEDWSERETIDGLEVTRLSLRSRHGRKQLLPLIEWAQVVHTHDAYPFLKYYLPYRFLHPRLPVFTTFHGYEGYPIPLEAKALRRIVLWLTRGTICAGAFIPRWYHFTCTHLTHGGVDAPPERPPLGESAVFVGRLEADTGFLQYLKAVRLLKEKHAITLPLEVCGDGSLRTEGERTATEAGLQVAFHGSVSDVMPYLAQARFAFTSGLLGMLEAMAAGSAVLALYDNPLKEDYLRLFPGAEHVCIADSEAELANQLVALMRSPEALEQRVAAAYEFAKEQTWAKVAEAYLSLYRSVASGGGEA